MADIPVSLRKALEDGRYCKGEVRGETRQRTGLSRESYHRGKGWLSLLTQLADDGEVAFVIARCIDRRLQNKWQAAKLGVMGQAAKGLKADVA